MIKIEMFREGLYEAIVLNKKEIVDIKFASMNEPFGTSIIISYKNNKVRDVVLNVDDDVAIIDLETDKIITEYKDTTIIK
jgi:hypothetical protein